MTARCSVFIATSLDGFIARSDGSIDWLLEANRSAPPGEDCGYRQFLADVDVLVMGRNTFEQALTFESWPYGSTPVVVLTRRGLSLPPTVPPSVAITSETPTALLTRLAAGGARKLYIDGGQTVQGFLAAGLIDELTITVIPILLGSGKPLFGPLPGDLRLVHEATTSFEFGFVQNRYRVMHPDQS